MHRSPLTISWGNCQYTRGATREILERPDVTFVRFDNRQLTVRDVAGWCRAREIKQELQGRVAADTEKNDKEQGCPARSNAAQVELQQAYMVIDTMKAALVKDPHYTPAPPICTKTTARLG